jgi:hypothetical protein
MSDAFPDDDDAYPDAPDPFPNGEVPNIDKLADQAILEQFIETLRRRGWQILATSLGSLLVIEVERAFEVADVASQLDRRAIRRHAEDFLRDWVRQDGPIDFERLPKAP